MNGNSIQMCSVCVCMSGKAQEGQERRERKMRDEIKIKLFLFRKRT